MVQECLVDVEFVSNVRYEESVWMKVRGGRGREALYIYMPTDSTVAAVVEDSYSKLKEDVPGFMQKGRVVLLCNFKARVGRVTDVEDVIGMFGEGNCNASGNRFLNEVELVINDRKLVSEPEWTRVRPSLKQKSVIDYIVTDVQLMREPGEVQVDTTDIGATDHFLVWLELGRVTKCFKKQKRTVRKWCLDRLADEEVRVKYKEDLKAEVKHFQRASGRVSEGMRGSWLVNAAVEKWEQVVKKVASAKVGEKVIVCGRAVRWWGDEKIEERREVYRKILRGQGDLWGDYTKLRKEVKGLVIEKMLAVWNEVVERANEDFECSRKEFGNLLVEGHEV